MRLAEAEVGEGILDRVDTADHGDITGAGLQVAHGQVDGGQRGCAGGIDRVVDAAEIEPVGNPAGGDVH